MSGRRDSNPESHEPESRMLAITPHPDNLKRKIYSFRIIIEINYRNMPPRTKKLLFLLFLSVIILILSIIFRPLEPEKGNWKKGQSSQNNNIQREIPGTN